MHYARYSWPAEFVVRAIKEVGWQNFSLDKARAPLANMGQAALRAAQRRRMAARRRLVLDVHDAGAVELRRHAGVEPEGASSPSHSQSEATTPQALLAAMLDRVTPAPFDSGPQQALLSYLVAGGAWTGSEAQVNTRAAGLARLLVALVRIPAGLDESRPCDVSRRLFIRDGVATVTLGLAAPAVPDRHRAGAGPPVAPPRRRLPRRRQRRAQHAGPLSGRGLLQPPSDDCDPRGPGAAGGHRCRAGARSGCTHGWAASGASSTRGVSRSCSAPATRTRAARTSRPATSGAPPTRSRRPDRAGSGRYLDTLPRPVDALAAWNTTGRDAARARVGGRPACRRLPTPATYTYREPEPRLGRAARSGPPRR